MSMLKALDIQNLPTSKEEQWKYTNLPRAVPSGLTLITDNLEKVIHIPRGQICEQLEDIFCEAIDGEHLQPSLKVILEENSVLHLIERHEGQGSYWKNMITEITVAENARFYHYRLQEDSDESVHTNIVSVSLARNSYYEQVNLNSGAKLSRHQIHACLEGEGGECVFKGINLLGKEQVGDTTILIEHKAPQCRSHQNYRSVLDDQSTGVFQGKVYVHQAAQKTDGYQKSDTLILSEGAQMNTKPELEIYADDVKCSHGTTTGKLDETPLFYLRSRGIPESESRNLLIQSFVGEVLDNNADENIKDLITDKVIKWLKR